MQYLACTGTWSIGNGGQISCVGGVVQGQTAEQIAQQSGMSPGGALLSADQINQLMPYAIALFAAVFVAVQLRRVVK